MGRGRWSRFAVVGAVLVLAMGCTGTGGSSTDLGDKGPATTATADRPTSTSPPLEPTSASPPATIATAAGPEPVQASTGSPTCGLARGRNDFSDQPPVAGDPLYGTPPPPLAGPPAGAVATRSPDWPNPLNRLESWFQLRTNGLARFDPRSGASERVLRATGGCSIGTADAGHGLVAAYLCHGLPGEAGAEPCQVDVVTDDGAPVGSWAIPGIHRVSLTWDQGFVVISVSGSGPDSYVLRIDPRTGTGTKIRTLPFECVSPGFAEAIPRSPLVLASCSAPDRQDRVVFDAGTGELRARIPYSATDDHLGDGSEVWEFGKPRRDSRTYTETGPSHVAPDVLLKLLGPSPDLLQKAIEVGTSIWIARCLDGCRGPRADVEIARLDATTGAVTDRWLQAGLAFHLRNPQPNGGLLSVDDDGAWILSNGHLFRINRHR